MTVTGADDRAASQRSSRDSPPVASRWECVSRTRSTPRSVRDCATKSRVTSMRMSPSMDEACKELSRRRERPRPSLPPLGPVPRKLSNRAVGMTGSSFHPRAPDAQGVRELAVETPCSSPCNGAWTPLANSCCCPAGGADLTQRYRAGGGTRANAKESRRDAGRGGDHAGGDRPPSSGQAPPGDRLTLYRPLQSASRRTHRVRCDRLAGLAA